MILTDLGQMRDRERIAKQLLRQSRGGNELHAEEVVDENCPANVGGWSGSVITLVHEDTRRLCYAIFFAGFGSLQNSSLASADRVCRAAGSLSVSWSLPCVSICPGAAEDDKRIVG